METLLNVHNFHSEKKNRDYSVIQVLRELTIREIENGFLGTQAVEEIFLPDNLVGKFGQKDIGKEIVRQYSVVGGKAILDDIVLKN